MADFGQLAPQPGAVDFSALTTPQFQSSLPAAQQMLKLSPEERALYERHLTNLTGPGGVDNPDGSRSTLFVNTFGLGNKTAVIPSVWGGKILTPDESLARAKAEGLDKFPSYATPEEADARYGLMHSFMERDTKQYLGSRK